ncbi:MAG: serine protease [Lachnospiraceae bacterium]|nr:serine protease [Lachnospiraceae bacterium]
MMDEMQKKEDLKQEEQEQEITKKKKGKRMAKWIVAALVVGMLTGTVFEGEQYIQQLKDEKKQAKIEKKQAEQSALTTSSVSGKDVSSVVSNVMPSIVAIDTTVSSTVEYFGQSYKQDSSGSGSGIIIGENENELLIVTNNHVVEGDNATVKVTFSDESTAEATIKGADSNADLAVLAVKKTDLKDKTKKKIKIATLGDSSETKVGDMSIAIGNALGYGQSVTVGYISAKDRKVSMEDSTMTLLQTDAAINPGNSGGALINASGEVIGINSVKYASDDVEGMGYAIPISDAVPIINELMNREQLSISEQGYLGIKGLDITEQLSNTYNMPEGIYVSEVTAGSPAEKGNIVTGDIITEINGREVKTLEELQEVLTYTKAGTEVSITVKKIKNGEYEKQKCTVTLGSKGKNASKSEQENTQKNQKQQK